MALLARRRSGLRRITAAQSPVLRGEWRGAGLQIGMGRRPALDIATGEVLQNTEYIRVRITLALQTKVVASGVMHDVCNSGQFGSGVR